MYIYLDFQAYLTWKLQGHCYPRSKATHKREEVYKLVLAAQQHDVAVPSRPVVDGFVEFDGIPVLLQILATSSKLYFNGRLEVVRNVMVNSRTIYL